MKIKQQKQVKSYLIEEFGPNKGNEIFDKQEKELYKIIKISNQYKTYSKKYHYYTHRTKGCCRLFFVFEYV